MAPRTAIIGTRGYPSYYGGFETAVRKLAPYLANAGWEVTVYGRHGAIHDHDSSRDDRVVSVTTHGLESKSLSTLSYGLTAVLHAIWIKPEVAIVMNVANGFWLPLLRIRGIPTVVNVDGIEWDREKWGKVAKFVFKLGAKFTARFATELVADSKAIQSRWKAEFGRRSTFIPYGGDVPSRLPVRHAFPTGTYVLMVARFVPENTVSEFFDAVELIAAHHTVVIVGSSGYGSELDDRAQLLSDRYKNVHWLGHVSDDERLLSLWQHAGVYFHGHSVGGTNPALVQAMACGAPIIARDTVYNREVLEEAGIYVTADREAIATSISQLLDDEPRQIALSQAALLRAQTHYGWRSVCHTYLKVLEKHVEN